MDMIPILISIFALFLSLVFGLFGFFNNLIGKSPSITTTNSAAKHQPEGTALRLENRGLGPALVTKIIVRYEDTVFGIECATEINDPYWLDNLWEEVSKSYRSAKAPPIQELDYKALRVLWTRGKSIVLGVSDRVALIEIADKSSKSLNHICNFVAHLSSEVYYESFYGIKYTNKKEYDPLGNIKKRSWLFNLYLLLAKLFGLIK